MSLKKSSEDIKRTRNWVCIVYPDSAPENWRSIIDDYHIQWIESPLHNLDVNPDTGELKKAHWHVLLLFDGVKTFDQVKEITSKINAAIPVKCASSKGTVRYMAHLDNPEKAQYNFSDIKAHGGADVSELLKPTSSERYKFINEMCDFIKDNEITEFQDVVDYARINHFETWFPLLCDNSAYIIGQYVKSQRHRRVKGDE